ncbi:hypothetical protein IAQ61_001181 [Plenodomus lingam]|uniref:Protein artemis n=1 Tax=Leptosphaeria maculans (strain JN3 / isolate v23.1.3 / race Av1-4-5-6-7-8) TaxID=985895 RepID=E5A1P0_LEPMJ|nr:hypothetical protein LEMA_P090160.1 [Plenodomus lingam JN3]KAH9880887.1 hypothetical protein IAQ61_001181 [Plenodomus lingam]CBX97607.1 hypothetical protein LEMA_P090160.1 [Plenodomus lingam JN3]
MSTFRGIVAEFPRIRIDYFRQQAEHKPPLACFLSHVHSDHLTGLESLRAPFVYCSAATREILLRLEKYHYRINFAKGVLESRNVTYDRCMRRLAKPLPLDTPTTIELAPGNIIRVTCIDANHCVGAVMFLIEGDGKAILYTGDIRAEIWWVNSLVQNPLLLPYTLGPRRLDCMYLDTTFATKSESYREFPGKAEGIRELLAKISSYSDDTIFYFHAWTFGYENVWIALSNFLKSRIHLDDYRSRIYGSLSTLTRKELANTGLNVPSDNRLLRESGQEIREAPALCGFRNGNHVQPGCLTSQEAVRIHSCERGMGCRVMDQDESGKVVHIFPIITRTRGAEIAELGAGGGQGDLDQKEVIETGDVANIRQLMELCSVSIEDKELCTKVLALLEQNLQEGASKLGVDLQLRNRSQDSLNRPSLRDLVSILVSRVSSEPIVEQPQNKSIRFPYSRHSSYSELRHLVAAFRPSDLYPCTIDNKCWTPEISMRSLFGDLCFGNAFRHDAELMEVYDRRQKAEKIFKRDNSGSWSDMDVSDNGVVDADIPERVPMIAKRKAEDIEVAADPTARCKQLNVGKDNFAESEDIQMGSLPDPSNAHVVLLESPDCIPMHTTAAVAEGTRPIPLPVTPEEILNPLPPSATSIDITTSERHMHSKTPKLNHKQLAYNAALGTGLTWHDYGGLVSTRSKADREEQEL